MPATDFYGPPITDVLSTVDTPGIAEVAWAEVAGGTWGQRYSVTVGGGADAGTNDPSAGYRQIFQIRDSNTGTVNTTGCAHTGQLQLEIITQPPASEPFAIKLFLSEQSDGTQNTWAGFEYNGSDKPQCGSDNALAQGVTLTPPVWIIGDVMMAPAVAATTTSDMLEQSAAFGETAAVVLNTIYDTTMTTYAPKYFGISIVPFGTLATGTSITVEIGYRVEFNKDDDWLCG